MKTQPHQSKIAMLQAKVRCLSIVQAEQCDWSASGRVSSVSKTTAKGYVAL